MASHTRGEGASGAIATSGLHYATVPLRLGVQQEQGLQKWHDHATAGSYACSVITCTLEIVDSSCKSGVIDIMLTPEKPSSLEMSNEVAEVGSWFGLLSVLDWASGVRLSLEQPAVPVFVMDTLTRLPLNEAGSLIVPFVNHVATEAVALACLIRQVLDKVEARLTQTHRRPSDHNFRVHRLNDSNLEIQLCCPIMGTRMSMQLTEMMPGRFLGVATSGHLQLSLSYTFDETGDRATLVVKPVQQPGA